MLSSAHFYALIIFLFLQLFNSFNAKRSYDLTEGKFSKKKSDWLSIFLCS